MGRLKGSKQSEITRQKIGETLKSKLQAPELRKKWSNAQLLRKERDGYINSPEARKKMSISSIGEKNHQWKGGIGTERQKFDNTKERKEWRKSIFERDNYKCQDPSCDKTERYLEAHHIKRWTDYPELRLSIENGITLCHKCHAKIFHKEQEVESIYINIIKEKSNV